MSGRVAQGLAKRLRRPVLVDDAVMVCELDEDTTLGTVRDDNDAVYIIARGVPAQDKARIRQALSTALYRSAYLFSHQLRGE